MTSRMHLLQNGRCERCETPQQDSAVFCSECGLRLGAGMLGAEVAMAEREAVWIAAHPERAAAWQEREERLQLARERAARKQAAKEALRAEAAALASTGDPARTAALDQLGYWTMRGKLLWDLTSEANAQAMQAHAACKAAGVSDAEIRARMEASAPPLHPGGTPTPAPMISRPAAAGPTAAAAAGGGGFFLFYAESGIDADGDGDVDGGLIDTITGGGEGGTLLDGIGDLFS